MIPDPTIAKVSAHSDVMTDEQHVINRKAREAAYAAQLAYWRECQTRLQDDTDHD